jgi:RNA polymerase sigma-70 factor (ECF subfamily)
MNSLTDEQLMELFSLDKDGLGAIAFDHLYKRYSKRMVNFFYYSLWKDFEKAQDFLHDLFLRIIENKEKFDKDYTFQAWIYRIASNMCKNEFRRNEIDKTYQSHVINTSDIVDKEQHLNNELQKYINSLEPEQRSLIILRFKFNLTIKEIATVFECPEGTIKSRLFYATKELSSKYKSQGYANKQ